MNIIPLHYNEMNAASSPNIWDEVQIWCLAFIIIAQHLKILHACLKATQVNNGFISLCEHSMRLYIRWSKKVAQLLVGHNFKTARKNSTKQHTMFCQHTFNHCVDFQSKWTTNVEMTVALKLGVKKSNIIDTSNIGCV